MSSDDRNPLKAWALELKAKLIPPVSADKLFFEMVNNDSPEITNYFHGYRVPKNPEDRQRLDDRLHLLRYIATQAVVN